MIESMSPVQRAITTIRTLAMDAVQAANSGHPGTPMAMAPVVHTLWPNRDRFVLSIGHASTLLYAMLHLTGVKAVNPKYETLGELAVTLDDIKRFRQLDSKTPGHPEYRWTSGVETTTGLLGQGVATSVGMAIGSRWMGAYFNRPGLDMFDYNVYTLCGDGDMMEGVTGEAASLAGHLGLSNLCWIYDNNKITIEGETSLAFSEDARPAIRLSALMELPVIHIFTHDSIGVGEDGPTHQPVEHLASLRAIPGLIDLRPADANEVVEAWRVILQLRHRPVALFLSRQALPTLDRSKYASAEGLARGAYVLADVVDGDPDVILMGTGSEVHLCVNAYEQLSAEGIKTRVVSMPSWELFEQQDQAYKDQVLPPHVTARISVEQASALGWDRYVLSTGCRIGMETFGASAPLAALQQKFGFLPQRIVEAAKEQLALKTLVSCQA